MKHTTERNDDTDGERERGGDDFAEGLADASAPEVGIVRYKSSIQHLCADDKWRSLSSVPNITHFSFASKHSLNTHNRPLCTPRSHVFIMFIKCPLVPFSPKWLSSLLNPFLFVVIFSSFHTFPLHFFLLFHVLNWRKDLLAFHSDNFYSLLFQFFFDTLRGLGCFKLIMERSMMHNPARTWV